MELLTRQFNLATKCGGFALGTEDAAFSYLAMSASSDTPDQDPRWFAPLLYAYTPECYPTHIRNSGSGLGYGIGRLSNVAGPLIVAFLFNHYGYKSVFVYVAAMWLLVAVILSAFGPLTKGRTLA